MWLSIFIDLPSVCPNRALIKRSFGPTAFQNHAILRATVRRSGPSDNRRSINERCYKRLFGREMVYFGWLRTSEQPTKACPKAAKHYLLVLTSSLVVSPTICPAALVVAPPVAFCALMHTSVAAIRTKPHWLEWS